MAIDPKNIAENEQRAATRRAEEMLVAGDYMGIPANPEDIRQGLVAGNSWGNRMQGNDASPDSHVIVTQKKCRSLS